jgi:sulfatase modifying factor 1
MKNPLEPSDLESRLLYGTGSLSTLAPEPIEARSLRPGRIESRGEPVGLATATAHRRRCWLGFLLGSLQTLAVFTAQAIEIPMAEVGDPGNAPDPLTGQGAVSYNYSIGKFDITIAEYTAFLNAVAKRDKYHLYSPQEMIQMGWMGDSQAWNARRRPWETGIARTGNDGSYTYTVIGSSERIPADRITWFDAARFCNWLHNGQPADLGEVAGSTETGAYTLNGDYTKGGETRNPGAKWWLPSFGEWYKAAFYDPSLKGGAGGYWRYPTRSNTPPGNEIGDGTNEANAIATPWANSVVDFDTLPKEGLKVCLLTPVGSFPNTHSFYGCCDLCGNVSQWTDTIVIPPHSHTGGRAQLGGGFNSASTNLQSVNTLPHLKGDLPERTVGGGFRVAAIPGAPQGKR